MQRFKDILVVVDEKTENRPVVERAVTLAQRNQARLTVVDTVGALPYQATRPITPESPAEAQDLVVDVIEDWPADASLPITPEPPATLQESFREWPDGAEAPSTEAEVVVREVIVERENERLERWIDFIRGRGVPANGKMLYGTAFLADHPRGVTQRT